MPKEQEPKLHSELRRHIRLSRVILMGVTDCLSAQRFLVQTLRPSIEASDEDVKQVVEGLTKTIDNLIGVLGQFERDDPITGDPDAERTSRN